MAERKSMLLRLDPTVHDSLARWASDDRRSANAQIEYLLRRALGRRPPARSRPADAPPGAARHALLTPTRLIGPAPRHRRMTTEPPQRYEIRYRA